MLIWVDLRRTQLGVAEHGLDVPDVAAVLQEQRRHRVPEEVAAAAFADAGGVDDGGGGQEGGGGGVKKAPPSAVVVTLTPSPALSQEPWLLQYDCRRYFNAALAKESQYTALRARFNSPSIMWRGFAAYFIVREWCFRDPELFLEPAGEVGRSQAPRGGARGAPPAAEEKPPS